MQHIFFEKVRFSLKCNTKADFAQPAGRDPPAGNDGNGNGHSDTSRAPSQRAQGSHTPCGAVHPPHSDIQSWKLKFNFFGPVFLLKPGFAIIFFLCNVS